MSSWFNSRVIVVIISLFTLVRLTQHSASPDLAVQHDIYGCAALLVLFILVYLIPLWRTFGFRRVIGALMSIIAAWAAAALALISDATNVVVPNAPDERHYNWVMFAFCLAGGVAFYLFFESTGRAFRLRDEIQAIKQTTRNRQ